jgi:heme A synthase
MRRLSRFAWFLLAGNIAVILWGAFVRATGSGAGCGAHWPLCNGEVIPRAPDAQMLVEFSHRLTSGLALLGVVALLVWTLRATPAGHPARRGAWLTMGFMLTEAAVGAGLVLFQLVADNTSMARAMFMAVHLLNTFALLACLTLTAHWLSGGRAVATAGRGAVATAFAGMALGMALVGTSGAIAALGDTLFPARSLADALAADLSPTSHLLIRLRVLHPALAIGMALVLALTVRYIPVPAGDARGRLAARAVVWLAMLQLAVGFINLISLAPVWLQLVHLLVADAMWIAFVLLGASALAEDRGAEGSAARAA